jgi:hypothetical protein
MSEEAQKMQVEQPKLHEPPPADSGTTVDGQQYKPARQDLRPQDVSLIENFIGGIYGEAKQIENNNIGDNQFTKAVKMDAAKEIINVRNIARGSQPQPAPQSIPQQPQQDPPVPVQQPMQQAIQNHVPTSTSDSLILKHEIDQLKEQVRDIKRVYDEFVKLKTVKGKWVIKHDSKTQSAPTISKTWNTLTKLLKNKTKSITIEYVEDE